jgi:hypothetical protein
MGRRVVKGGKTDRPTVPITRGAKDRLADWLEKNKRPEQGLVIAGIVEWFVVQEPAVQRAVLRGVDARLEPAYAAVLRLLADEVERGIATTASAPESSTEVRVGQVTQEGTRVRKMKVGSEPEEPKPPSRLTAHEVAQPLRLD